MRAAGSLDDDVIEVIPALPGIEHGGEGRTLRTADAARLDAGEVSSRLVQMLRIAQEIAVHFEFAHVIDDHAQAQLPAHAQQSAQERGFAGAEKAGDDGDAHARGMILMMQTGCV
jgi:hypothetical protein